MATCKEALNEAVPALAQKVSTTERYAACATNLGDTSLMLGDTRADGLSTSTSKTPGTSAVCKPVTMLAGSKKRSADSRVAGLVEETLDPSISLTRQAGADLEDASPTSKAGHTRRPMTIGDAAKRSGREHLQGNMHAALCACLLL